jgi:acyl-CoA thioesterase-2
MAASRTTPGRTPHSVHVYYLRAGDSRRPVEFQVVRSRDGGTLSTRHITARQDGEVLLEALASFSTPVDGLDYHAPMADVPDPTAPNRHHGSGCGGARPKPCRPTRSCTAVC